MVDLGSGQAAALFTPTTQSSSRQRCVARLRRGFQKRESAGLGRKMPFVDGHLYDPETPAMQYVAHCLQFVKSEAMAAEGFPIDNQMTLLYVFPGLAGHIPFRRAVPARYPGPDLPPIENKGNDQDEQLRNLSCRSY